MHAYTHTLHYYGVHLEIYSQEMLRIVKKIIDVSIPNNVLVISSQSETTITIYMGHPYFLQSTVLLLHHHYYMFLLRLN